MQYIRCLYVYNKIDTLSIEEVDELARKPDSVVISIYLNLNLDFMLQQVWRYMGLIRVYTKRRGQPPDLLQPVVLAVDRDGLSVEAVCKGISKELLEIFSFALVWGRSTKYNPQRVGVTHALMDEDVVQVVAKTLVQQKHSKDYGQRVSDTHRCPLIPIFIFKSCIIIVFRWMHTICELQRKEGEREKSSKIRIVLILCFLCNS